MWYDLFIWVIWLIHTCDMTTACVCRGFCVALDCLLHLVQTFLICVTWRLHRCDMIHSHVWQIWVIYMCDHLHVWNDAFTPHTKEIGCKKIATTKISASLDKSPHTFQQKFSRESQNFQTVFHVSKRESPSLKRVAGKTGDSGDQTLSLISSVSAVWQWLYYSTRLPPPLRSHIFHMCDVTHSYVWHDSFMCDMTHSFEWHSSFIRVTWPICMCDVALLSHLIDSSTLSRHFWYVWNDSFIRVTWLLHTCGTWLIHKCNTRLIHMCDRHEWFISEDMNHSCLKTWIIQNVQDDAFIRVTLSMSEDMNHSCHICAIDMNNSCLQTWIIHVFRHESFMSSDLNHSCLQTWIIHVFRLESVMSSDMNHSCLQTWIIHVFRHESFMSSDMNHSCLQTWIIHVFRHESFISHLRDRHVYHANVTWIIHVFRLESFMSSDMNHSCHICVIDMNNSCLQTWIIHVTFVR